MSTSSDPAARARAIRRDLLDLVCRLGGGHLGGCLSAVEIMAFLYHDFLRLDPAVPEDPGRDRFILSKGHAALLLYLLLHRRGFITAGDLATINTPSGRFGTHPEYDPRHGIEATTGSLGQGLSVACGLALAGLSDRRTYRTVALLGDGECQEGAVWEAALFAARHCLARLIVIVDHNNLQAISPCCEVTGSVSLAGLWQACGWACHECDGHDTGQLAGVVAACVREAVRPSVIIAHTVKGKGISFMENVPLWHYRCPSPSERDRARAELADA